MGATLRVLLALGVAGFRRFTAYPLAALAGVVANVTFGYIRGAVLLALAAASSAGAGAVGTVGAAGYDAASLTTYNWLTQASIGALAIWGTTEVTERVRTGDIAVDLARPVDLQLAYLAQDLGRAAASVLLRGVPTVLVGVVSVTAAGVPFDVPSQPLAWIAGALSATLGLVVSFLSRFALQLASFWIVETRGLQTLYMVASGFFAGLILPLPLMPGWMQTVAAWTPFPAMLQLPVDVLSGRATGADVAVNLLVQVAWIAGLTLLGRALLSAGTRRLVVQGG